MTHSYSSAILSFCLLSGSVPVDDAESIAQAIERGMLRDVNFITEIEIIQCESVPLQDFAGWLEENWKRSDTIVLTCHGDLLTQRLNRAMVGEGAPWSLTVHWDGTRAYQWDGEVPGAILMGSQIGPIDLTGGSFIFSLIDGRFPSSSPRPLPEQVRMMPPIAMEEDDAEGLLHLALRPFNESSPWRTTWTLRRMGDRLLPHTIRSVLYDADRLRAGEEFVRMDKTFRITRWEERDGVLIPWEAVYESRDRGPNDVMYYCEERWERLSFEFLHDEPGEESNVPKHRGMRMIDVELNLSFEIGSSFITVDGQQYELDAPITEHPGDNLADILKRAKRLDVPHASFRADPAQREDPSLPMIAWGIGGAMLIAIGATLLWVNLRSNRRGIRSEQ